jgi:hypothetical protein
MTAETIAKALGARKAGAAWMAKCPTHDDREFSLSIREAEDGKVLVRCHAGCEQHQIIAALKASGIWADTGRDHAQAIGSHTHASNQSDQSDSKRTQAALSIWNGAGPAAGTLVDYLRSRGIVIPLSVRAFLATTCADGWKASRLSTPSDHPIEALRPAATGGRIGIG